MIYHRRALLKQLLFVSATAAISPSCLFDKHKSGISLKHITVSSDEEAVFASLFETILPDSETPGAKSLHLDLFAWKYLDDCRTKDDQNKILKGLQQLNLFSQKEQGSFFNRSSIEQREKILTRIEQLKDPKNSLFEFYLMVKGLAIQSYTSSEYFMTQVQLYEQIPGRFHGCVKA